MSQHTCREYNPGCWRCDLSRVEVATGANNTDVVTTALGATETLPIDSEAVSVAWGHVSDLLRAVDWDVLGSTPPPAPEPIRTANDEPGRAL